MTETMNQARYVFLEEMAAAQINGELAPEMLDPKEIITDIKHFLLDTVYMSLGGDEVRFIDQLSLWIYGTYFYREFADGFPYLLIQGEAGTGKTTIAEAVAALAFNAKHAEHMTENALLRSMNSRRNGTFIFDDSSTLFDEKEDYKLEEILKAGYRDDASYWRIDEEKDVPRQFSAFSPKVICRTKPIDPVIEDRCIKIITRRATSEQLMAQEDIKDRDVLVKAGTLKMRMMLSTFLNAPIVRVMKQNQDDKPIYALRNNLIQKPLAVMARLVDEHYAIR